MVAAQSLLGIFGHSRQATIRIAKELHAGDELNTRHLRTTMHVCRDVSQLRVQPVVLPQRWGCNKGPGLGGCASEMPRSIQDSARARCPSRGRETPLLQISSTSDQSLLVSRNSVWRMSKLPQAGWPYVRCIHVPLSMCACTGCWARRRKSMTTCGYP